MALHLIVDGYNLMGAAPGELLDAGGDLEHSREELLRRLRSLCLRKHLKITVVFDSMGTQTALESRAGIRVAFAGGRGRADEAIIKMVRANPQAMVVATSDRAVAEACRKMGAAVITSQELWSRMESLSRSGQAGFGPPKEDYLEEEAPGRGGFPKKGPARRPSRKERREARRLRKL